ncbi:MAG: hypothetical protein JKX73_06945 [Flavobacteriales bacterium]|nr:hypothetical protein [Flavobacteriales bacterium]
MIKKNLYRIVLMASLIALFGSSKELKGAACTPSATNDNCVSAISLTVGAPCTNGTTCNATLEGGETVPSCTSPAETVWYSFVAPSPRTAVIMRSDASNGCVMYSSVWSGACMPSVELSCGGYGVGDPGYVHHLTTLTGGGTYYVQASYASGGPCGSEALFCIEALDAPYCPSIFRDNTYGWITNVTFNTINNTSIWDTPRGYGNYLGTSTTVNQLGIYNLSVEVQVPSSGNNEVWAWFDWNQDNDFDDVGEAFNIGPAVGICTPCAPLVTPITIPGTATLGSTRMRITEETTVTPTPCVSYYWGNTEDYTIIIDPPIPGDAYGIYATDGGFTITDCEIFAVGGTGGTGCLVCTPTDDAYSNVAISSYPTITEDNINCTSVNIDFSTVDGAPHSWNFGAGAAPATSTSSPAINVQYATTGRKNIVYDANTYTGFENISMAAPTAGAILGPSAICPETRSYSSPDAGTPGYNFLWTVSDPAGGTSSITSPTASTTDIDLTNTTAGNISFTVKMDIESECCGPLPQISKTITVFPNPATPAVPNPLQCTGSSLDLSVTSPNPAYNYLWYDAPTGGTFLGSSATLTIDPVLAGATSYYVEAQDVNGCASASRVSSTVTGTDIPPDVSFSSINQCEIGTESVCVTTPIPGATYSFYEADLTTLLQTGLDPCYDLFNPGPAPNTESVWVSVIDPGCDETTRSQIDYVVPAGCGDLYRSIATGDWSATTTWEVSSDNGATWVGASVAPSSTDEDITVRQHTVTITTVVTFDQTVVEIGGTLNYTGGTVTVVDGTGVDLTINGTYIDAGTSSHTFTGTWIFGDGATLIRTGGGTSSDNWQNSYDGGAGNINPTAYWIIRKTGAGNPTLTSVDGYYPNLIIENNDGGTPNWVMAAGSIITGAATSPYIIGNFDIGGQGTQTVSFLNDNTNASTALVGGSLIIRNGSTLRNYGTGFTIQGDSLDIEGSLLYDADDARQIRLTGPGVALQQIVGSGSTVQIYSLTINKSSGNVILNRPITVDNSLLLSSGILLASSTNRLTLAAGATITPVRGSATSFVSGFIDRVINATGDVEFPMGNSADTTWRPITFTSLDATTRTWTVEFISGDPEVDLGNSFDPLDSVQFLFDDYYYDITRVPATGSMDLKMWYEEADLNSANESSTYIGNWCPTCDGGSGWWNSWNKDLASDWARDGTNNWVQVKNVPLFGFVGPGTGSNNYYWVGEGGDWTAFGTHWVNSSGGSVFYTSVPGANDDVYFDSNSSTGQVTITMNGGTWYCKSFQTLDIAKTPTITGTGMLIVTSP